MLGNYVGAIALCGIVAEKVAIFVHAAETPEDAKREAFEARDQYRRVQELKDSGWITPQSVQDFDDTRAAQKKYLHYWTSINDERTTKDAVRSYAAATRVVVAAMGWVLGRWPDAEALRRPIPCLWLVAEAVRVWMGCSRFMHACMSRQRFLFGHARFDTSTSVDSFGRRLAQPHRIT